MDSTINYPLYHELICAFIPSADPHNCKRNRTFWQFANLVNEQRLLYSDYVVPLLGNFSENHDNERLRYYSDDLQLRRGMYLYVLAAEGIPLIYYGMDKDFTQANRTLWGDDARRPPFWESKYGLPTGAHDWIKKVNSLRKRMSRVDFATAKQYERHVSDDMYVFQRGLILVALTNGGTGYRRVSQTILDVPWKEDTRVCNIFDAANDCTLMGANRSFEVVLLGGESKLYAPDEYAMPKTPTSKGFL